VSKSQKQSKGKKKKGKGGGKNQRSGGHPKIRKITKNQKATHKRNIPTRSKGGPKVNGAEIQIRHHPGWLQKGKEGSSGRVRCKKRGSTGQKLHLKPNHALKTKGGKGTQGNASKGEGIKIHGKKRSKGGEGITKGGGQEGKNSNHNGNQLRWGKKGGSGQATPPPPFRKRGRAGKVPRE